MVPVREKPALTDAYDLPLVRLRCSASPPPVVTKPATRQPETRARKPTLRCGLCHGVIDDLVGGRSDRCPHCQRSLDLPRHLRLTCDRCGHHHHIRPRELGAERLCPTCGKPFVVGDVALNPRRRHRVQRQSHHTVSRNYADAAWAVLILGLALVIALLAITL